MEPTYQCSTCGKSISHTAASINGAFILAFGRAMGDDFQHFMDEDKTNIFKAPLFFCKNCQDKKTKLAKAINVLQKELNELTLKPSH